MILVFIRHGETRANEEHRYLGKTDESLSKRGIEGLLFFRKENRYPEVDYLFTSPMRRCIESAEILYPMLSPIVIPEWEEMDFGQFEYKNYEDLKKDIRYQEWIDSGGILDFPEGESRVDFLRRCEKGFQRMRAQLRKLIEEDVKENGKEIEKRIVRVGLIVHGGTIMALLSSHGKNEYFDYQAANGRGYLCSMEGWKIKEMAEI